MTNLSTTTILGIDPGFDRMGWAIGTIGTKNELSLLEYGCILTAKNDDIFVRYTHLQKELSDIISKHQPHEAAIESLFFLNNQKTAMRVSEARGLIIASLLSAECSVFEYTPLQIKQAITGYGRAEKTAVEKMVRLQLKIQEKKIVDDTMDALAILLTHSTARTVRKFL